MTNSGRDYRPENRPPPGVMHGGILTAARIATMYATRLPTVKELMERWGMSRATAFRWRAALKLARQEVQ